MQAQPREPLPTEPIVTAVQELSAARTLEAVMKIVRRAARELTGADGATFILREGDFCHYVDEDAIGPLWKGRRFPIASCISGWAMLNRRPAVVPDIFADGRIPLDAYRATFVKSLVMVPIRPADPIGAIGNYWATPHTARPEEVWSLQALASATSVAVENVRLYGELEEGIRARDEFLAVAAHELRTPLTALQLNLQSLQREVGADSTLDTSLGPKISGAVAGSSRLCRLVEILLDVSSISMGALRLERARAEIGALARGVIDRFAEAARRARCELVLRAEQKVEGEWDALRLEQVLANLLSNALKYGAGAPVEVTVACNRGAAKVTVRDHGAGITPDGLSRIFSRFGRASSLRQYGGFGLGLYVSRAIVEAHGGTLTAQSDAGAGATFTVELPTSVPPSRLAS